MSKDCFYMGLRAEHRPMVVHLKDHPNSTPLDLLAALMENEQQNDTLANARYPPATLLKVTTGVCHIDHTRALCHMDKQDRYAEQKTGGYVVRQMQLGCDEHARDPGDAGEDRYVVRPVQLGAEPTDDGSDTKNPMLDPNMNVWIDQGFYCGMVQAAEGADARFRCCFNCLEEGHRWSDCKKTPLLPELQEVLDREVLNRTGCWKQGRLHPHDSQEWQGKGRHPNQTCSVKPESKSNPFRYWNQNTLSHWLGPKNLGWALVDGIRTRVLLDNGTRVNLVTPAYVCRHNLKVGSIEALDHSMNPYGQRVPLMGVGGRTQPLGYVVIRIQVEGVPEYDEDQVAFIVDDNTTFSWRVPVVFGTPTINCIVTVMKESNINNAPMEWQVSKASYELANGFLMRRLHLEPEQGFPTNTGKNPVDLDETVSLTSKCVVPPFESVIMHGRTQQTMMMDHSLNVMTQAPYPDDMAALPNGIYIMRAYTDMKPGSCQVSIIVRNITSRTIHLLQGKTVA